ncbi:MAG TPA: TetR/AcrR family transcriptional regulator [Actinomycetota bacterium]|nr:TetR/AcrR family transcriptional regulator [Actinomycetota bacterium]
MLKADAQSTGRSTATRDRIVAAAVETLKSEGFAGASARAIARRGGFNQALVFYYFGSVRDLLIAALDATSEARMQSYRDALEGISDIGSAARSARALFRDDLASGHITVLSELVAGSIHDPELASALMDRVTPWLRVAEDAIERSIGDGPLGGLLPKRELAFAVLAFYLGVDLLTAVAGDRGSIDSLFDSLEGLASGVAGTAS